MNIRQLETFSWIAQLGTFSAAAEHLHTSQANVSARIRELEDELGIPLFDRIGRHVQLTAKARELLGHAQKVVSEAARLRLVAGKPGHAHGVARIGLGQAMASQSLVAIMREMQQRFAGIELQFDVDLNPSLVRKLLRGALDVAVVGGPVDVPDLQFEPVGAARLAWVGAPALWGGLAAIAPRDLAGHPIISLPRDARLYTLMQEWFSDAGVAPRQVSYCNSFTTMLEVVRAGLCACVVPATLVARDVEAGSLVAPTPVPALPPLRYFVATRIGTVDPAIPEIAEIVAHATRSASHGPLAESNVRHLGLLAGKAERTGSDG